MNIILVLEVAQDPHSSLTSVETYGQMGYLQQKSSYFKKTYFFLIIIDD